ncbi:MAG: HDOD domain-containing protein [Verrucomicrobiae bacterium]|nr:HDOD domain-containing protein [Verrucomicrobiae bacterium]
MTGSITAAPLLKDSRRGLFRDRVLREIKEDTTLPAISGSAQRLQTVVDEKDVSLDEVAQIVKTDPGLASKFLRLANSSYFGGKSIASIEDALFRLGMGEVRRMAQVVGVMDRVSHLKVKVDWKVFMLHCLLTGRLTERLAAAFRELSGKEYLAGFLHDMGKLYLEHFYPGEFEAVILRVLERGTAMHEVEEELIGITHAEISALLCEKWNVNKEVCRSIRFHHEPDSPFNRNPVNPEEQILLAACICFADALANICKANIHGTQHVQDVDFETLQGWRLLQQLAPRATLDLDVEKELSQSVELLNSFGV